MFRFTPEQQEFIRINVVGRSNTDLTKLFNERFDSIVNMTQIRAFKKNNKISSGLDGRFNKGHAPFNKGLIGVGGWGPTQFKKGHKPHNYKPVGTERVNADDYVDIKIADPNKWRGKHILVWEQHNGSVPKGRAIIFGDGDRRNFDLDNLICVTRAQLARLNQNHLIRNDADLTRTGVVIADIYGMIGAKKREKR